MIKAISCGGVVIHKNKVLVLYRSQNGRHAGWVMPKGTLEAGETYKQAALREVKEEAGVTANIVKYIGKTRYNFKGDQGLINKTVYWYLMTADSFYCRPQAEEYFADAGYYKRHEAYYLLKFHDERQMMDRAYFEYADLKKSTEWNKNNTLFFKRNLK